MTQEWRAYKQWTEFNSTSSLQLVGGYYLERVKTYANFDYAESANDGSSITGYYVFLGNT